MSSQRGFYRSDEPWSDDPDNAERRLCKTAARHGYRLQVRGDEVRFVDPDTGEVGVPLTWDDVDYNLDEFWSGDLMNGGRDFVHDPERV